mgnify:CR=1 FL=1
MNTRKVRTQAGIGKYRWDWTEFYYLVEVVAHSKNMQEILNLFIDLHTQKDMAEIIRRVAIASFLVEGKTYDEISELSGASRTTIARIANKLSRTKSVLSRNISKVGSLAKFKNKNKFGKVDERDSLTKMLDRAMYKRSLGLLGKR